MAPHCAAVDVSNPNDQFWSFCPSETAAGIMAVAFGIATMVHFFQMFTYSKPYCLAIVVAALIQTLSFIARYLSIKHPMSEGYYAFQFVEILVAPIFTNAFVYMVFGRMAWNFTHTAQVGGLRPWRFGQIFILLDLVSFLIQIIGGIKTANPHESHGAVMVGIHIYMGGIAFQQFFILVFCAFAFSFHRTMNREGDNPRKAYILLYTEYFGLLMITIRVIFRLCEFAGGTNGPTMTHEIYQYLLDTLPMFLAIIAFNFVHPGSIMAGKDGNFPSRKERKNGILSKVENKGNANVEMSSSELLPNAPVQYAGYHQGPGYRTDYAGLTSYEQA